MNEYIPIIISFSILINLALFCLVILIYKKQKENLNESELLSEIFELRNNLAERINTAELRSESKLTSLQKDVARMPSEFKAQIETVKTGFSNQFAALLSSLSSHLQQSAKNNSEAATKNAEFIAKQLKEISTATGEALEKLRQENKAQLNEIRSSTEKSLSEVRLENQKQLDEVRGVVEEKLDKTLGERLNQSFKLVDEKLAIVQASLGEMRIMAKNVDKLRNVLANVKTRGTFGEMQLEAILGEVFTPEQYAMQVDLAGEGTKCDFAIKMPGKKSDDVCWLPIDSKFPLEDWENLQAASDLGDKVKVEAARKGLEKALLKQAKSISEKYIRPPKTTEFALLFLPSESLYAEVLRIPGLFDKLQRDYHITPAGPVVFTALVNSLLMGFMTLAMEKRSSEVWKILAEVKKEFTNFSKHFSALEKKFKETQNSLSEMATRKNQMDRRMRAIDRLTSEDSLENSQNFISIVGQIPAVQEVDLSPKENI